MANLTHTGFYAITAIFVK